jgi:hypothetical protein
LVCSATFGTGSSDKPVSQKRFGIGVVQLLDGPFSDQVGLSQCVPEFSTNLTIRFAIGAAVVIKVDPESMEITLMFVTHRCNEVFFGTSLFSGSDHDCRAVCVVRADIDALVAAKLLEADPDVGLDVLHQMPDVNGAVGVGEGTGNEDLT